MAASPSGAAMASPTHFEMEQALRKAGIAVRPYPISSGPQAKDLRDEDQRLIASGTAWERELERLYAMHVQDQNLATHKDFAQELDRLCTEAGMHAALDLLNADVAHRYTGLYRLTPAAMVNVELSDKQREPRPDFLAEVPFADSFCQYVLRDGSFLTGDSGSDDRLNGHPYKGVMAAYCGVPIFDTLGGAIGTLCHFDMVKRDVRDEAVARLNAAATILSNYLG
jgi:hypothetical protein